ncbi:MAG: ribosome-associated translation inhibitor RaiA [Clostridiales bacterium]|jgi:putative sigma-54 modulation protein|nr:ribosome-associated translation inhibitor RaiA [Clostridiales bacterium]
MRIEFLARNYNAGEKLKDIIEKKIGRLDKFFEEDTKVKVVLKKTKDIETLEVTVLASSGLVRAEVSGENMYDNIDTALPKIEKQIVKHHEKLRSKKSKLKEIDFSGFEPAAAAEPDPKIVKSKVFDLVPMTVEDAIEELELVGHNFYIFLNKVTGGTSVVYLRNDGDYGVIETRI